MLTVNSPLFGICNKGVSVSTTWGGTELSISYSVRYIPNKLVIVFWLSISVNGLGAKTLKPTLDTS